MTTTIQTPWVAYQTNGITLSFGYHWMLRTASEMLVYWEDQLLTMGLYTVTGVGNPTGGSVVFTSPLPPGSLLLKRATPANQLTDYIEGDAFPADSHEEGLDKLTRLIQDLNELLSRIPRLPIQVSTDLRGLTLPPPGELMVFGWNSDGSAITLYPSDILQVQVGNTSHIAYGEVVRDVDNLVPFAGLVQIPITTVFPAGSIALGAIVRVKVTLGNSLGLTTFSAGSPTLMDLWGGELARTATAAPLGANNPGMWPAFEWRAMRNSDDVVLTADTGTFDGTGQLRITAGFLTMVSA